MVRLRWSSWENDSSLPDDNPRDRHHLHPRLTRICLAVETQTLKRIFVMSLCPVHTHLYFVWSHTNR